MITSELVLQATKKIDTLTQTAEKLRLEFQEKNRFIALGMLDFYLTQIPIKDLANYYITRRKGKLI